jgi:hypothetical protein
MEFIEQIKQICLETDNEWFLTHDFTKVALHDLKIKERFEKDIFDNRECPECHLRGVECISCEIECIRNDELEKLDILKYRVYDDETETYVKSKWIIPEKINGEIPGFILVECRGDGIGEIGFTAHLKFACVRHKYRKRGVLHNMVNSIPKQWNIWLEASSNDIENVENIWERCGFSYLKTIHGQHIIYKKMGV